MGISLKDQRRRSRRRSYADIKPPGRNNGGPRSDPLRILLYMLMIAAGIWIYFNQETVKTWVASRAAPTPTPDASAISTPGSSVAISPTPPDDIATLGEAEAASLAVQAYQQGLLQDAVHYYQRAAEAGSGNADYYVQIARIKIYQAALQYGEQSDTTLQEALEAANNAVLIAPYDPAGYAIKGKVQDWQGFPEDAQSTILQALDLNSDYALAYSYMAEAQIDLERWDQAQQIIEQALLLEPNHVDIHRDYAYILETLGQYQQAVEHYQTALRIQPNIPYLRVAHARILRVLGENDDALEQLDIARSLAPSNPIVQFEIGRTYETYVGDFNEAITYYQRATQLDSNYPSPWLRLGTLYYITEQYIEAIRAFEQALALNATRDELYYQLGLSYAADGRCANAINYLEQAALRAGDNERVQDAIISGYEACNRTPPTFDSASTDS